MDDRPQYQSLLNQKTQVIYSRANSKEKEATESPEMGYFNENEAKQQLIQNDLSDGRVINIKSRSSFVDRQSQKKKKKNSSRQRTMTYQMTSQSMTNQIIKNVQKD